MASPDLAGNGAFAGVAPAEAVGLHVERLTTTTFSSGLPALFLDRDGVIVVDTHYLHRVDDVAFIDDLGSTIAEVNRRGLPVVVVTNQAGIGRGYYGWEDFAAVQAAIVDELRRHGAHLDLVLACAYHRDGVGPYAVDDHPWRKPRPGMLLEAARLLGLDLARSMIVGDQAGDVRAGVEAGLRRACLVGERRTGEEASVRRWCTEKDVRLDTRSPAEVIAEWLREVA